MPPRSVEFFEDPHRIAGEADEPGPRPRRSWPLPVALALCAVLALVALGVRGTAARPHAGRAAPSNSTSSAAPSRSASRSSDQPPGCLSASSCRVSRRLSPSLLDAVRRHFTAARPLTGYAVFRAGRSPFGGGLQFRQSAFDVASGVLVITVRARSGEPPYPSFSLTDQGRTADLLVSQARFDVELRFTGTGGSPVSGQRLLALSDEAALTDVD